MPNAAQPRLFLPGFGRFWLRVVVRGELRLLYSRTKLPHLQIVPIEYRVRGTYQVNTCTS